MKTSVQTELPDKLISQAQTLIDHGWASDFDELLADALRRYLESHSSECRSDIGNGDISDSAGPPSKR